MMRATATAAALGLCIAAGAQGAQDFASRFMESHEEDTAVHCVTVSPTMMGQLMREADESREAHLAQALQKLKSARIVTASVDCDRYFQRAETLLRQNPQRFRHGQDYHSPDAHGAFYTRQSPQGGTAELIMLHADTKTGSLVIVNFTGDMDEEFAKTLRNHFSHAPQGN